MRYDSKLAIVAFVLVLIAMAVAAFFGWDYWSP
jgi:TRAP-type C4-dicarboxylate transport system permease small subunit